MNIRRASLALLVCAGCTGSIMEASDPGTPGAPPADGTSPPGTTLDPGGKTESADAWVLQRLTTREHNNTIRDLLLPTYRGILLPAGSDAVGDGGFVHAGNGTDEHVRSFMSAAEEIAAEALAAPGTRVVGCSPKSAAEEEACALTFTRDFGKRAFRRPLDEDEIENLLGLYRKARTMLGYDFQGAIALLVQRFLQSPSFLYHRERGAGAPAQEGALVSLGPYEMASRLSYLLWETMPDTVLFAAADGGGLATPEGVGRQALRLLSDKRSTRTLAAFHKQWLALEGVTGKDPRL